MLMSCLSLTQYDDIKRLINKPIELKCCRSVLFPKGLTYQITNARIATSKVFFLTICNCSKQSQKFNMTSWPSLFYCDFTSVFWQFATARNFKQSQKCQIVFQTVVIRQVDPLFFICVNYLQIKKLLFLANYRKKFICLAQIDRHVLKH